MRSLLFVPGDSRSKLDKALGSGADALIVDLEDSVSSGSKEAARSISAAFLAEAAMRDVRPLLFVRVNDLATGLTDEDLEAVMRSAPDGIVLPKAVGGRDIRDLAGRLDRAEARNGIAPGRTRILPIATETARGVLAIGTIPDASPRLCGVTWGGEDLSADIGAEANRDGAGRYTDPYRHARLMTLLTAAAAEVDAVDAVFTAFRDADGLAGECRAARRDGFVAKMAIHPGQVPVINAAFGASPEALQEAREIVALFAADPQAGVLGLNGRMIDRPHLRRAQRLLARNATARS
ncbi:CoA ester lyase [Methylobacterium sp. NEAU 140]|uniref:HpcH/HpaI aldolase/citrate lyase family protein n=1 Tax=Methylobacterium sp. NEAU 140 TaxID=3064945 RepID=UPI00273689FB|nr:CoA ester lyase [Methylobacterium sp. NEAU 140]MDP4021034.1 CoA ester lyase [Methylobacterium sp. NEAU 140]